MGIFSRFFSMLFLITLPVRLIIWSLTILFIFSLVTIDRLITYSGYYNLVRLQNYIEEQNDDFLRKICSDKSFSSCLMAASVFSRDDSTIVHSYAKYINQSRNLKNTQFPSTVQVDKEMLASTNLAVLKTLREGCVELARTTTDLINFYKIQVPETYTNSYICFKRNTYFTLFTKGEHCETCGVKLNEYFKKSSFTIYYGFESGFFDRMSRYLYENISGFFSTRSDKIKHFFVRGAKKISKTALVKISNDQTYQKPENLIEHKQNEDSDTNNQLKDVSNIAESDDRGQKFTNPQKNQNYNQDNYQQNYEIEDAQSDFQYKSQQSSRSENEKTQHPKQLRSSQNNSQISDDDYKYTNKISNYNTNAKNKPQQHQIDEEINYNQIFDEIPTDN